MAFLFTVCISCLINTDEEALIKESMMKVNLSIYVDSCWNSKNISLLESISSENFIRNMNGIQVANNQTEIRAHMEVFFRAFPDMKLSINNLYAKDDHLFSYWTFTGTNSGVFGEGTATGKKVKIIGSSILYFDKNRKMVQEDVYFNELDLVQQLGFTLNPPILE